MSRTKTMRAGWLYAYVHFAVEVCCFFWIVSRVGGTSRWVEYALWYDFLAFVPQLFIGMLADRLLESNRFKGIDLTGVGLILLAIGLFLPWNIPALVVITLGNCMVHVSGAENTLRGAEGKLSPAGIFVAGGSFGVVTGQLLGKYVPQMRWIPCGFLLLALILSTGLRKKTMPEAAVDADGFELAKDLPLGWIVGLSFLTVAVRSYMGYAIPISWNKTVWQTILLFGMMGIGKGLGGILADRFGARRVAILSLLLAMPLLVFGDHVMVISLIGVGLFSMTMSISLGVLVSVFPAQPGFAFGITTVGLFVGMLPAFLVQPEGWGMQAMVVVVFTLLAVGCFALVTKKE